MIKTIIFDMDGTLLNTLEDITDSVNAALEHFSYPAVTEEKVRLSVGNGAGRLMARVLPGGEACGNYEEVLDWYVRWYQAHCRIKTAPYRGIPEALETLKAAGTAMAIVSNKGDGAVRELTGEYFGSLCETSVGEREGIRRKPCPDSVLEAMRLLKADPAQTLYVGDSEVDYETARNAGIGCVLVSWGFRTREQLESLHPDILLDDPRQLADLVR